MAIIRGSTPKLEFELPLPASELAEAFVTIAQDKAVVIDKPLAECEAKGKMLTVRLSQEETLKLDSDKVSEIQIRARTLAGEAIASDIIRVSTARILKDGVI